MLLGGNVRRITRKLFMDRMDETDERDDFQKELDDFINDGSEDTHSDEELLLPPEEDIPPGEEDFDADLGDGVAGDNADDVDNPPEEDTLDDDEELPAEEEPSAPSELDQLKEQNKTLLEMMNKLQPQEAPKPKEKLEEKVDIFKSDSFKNLVKTLDMDDSEAGVFKAFLMELQAETTETSVNQALQSTPALIKESVNRKSSQDRIKKQFYTDHPQLDNDVDRMFVSTMASNIAKQDSTSTIEQILNKAADATYTARGIKKEDTKEKPAKSERRKPAFAKGSKGSRKTAPKKKGLESEISALFDD